MFLRTITNSGDPLIHPDGTPLAGVVVMFSLVDYTTKRITQQFDVQTKEWIAPAIVEVTTDANGEFSVDLWPNARGNGATCYKIEVDHESVKAFFGYVTNSAAPTTLYQITADYDSTVVGVPNDSLALHAADTTLHVNTETITNTPSWVFNGQVTGWAATISLIGKLVGNLFTFTINMDITAKGSAAGRLTVGLPYAADGKDFVMTALVRRTGLFIGNPHHALLMSGFNSLDTDIFDTDLQVSDKITITGSYISTLGGGGQQY